MTELWDAAAAVFTSGTYGWAVVGNNTIANVSNELEITYVDSAIGATVALNNATDLAVDLVVGQRYRFTFDGYYSGGAAGVVVLVNPTGPAIASSALTGVKLTYTISFRADHATTNIVSLSGMQASNVVYLDNLSLVTVVDGNYGLGAGLNLGI